MRNDDRQEELERKIAEAVRSRNPLSRTMSGKVTQKMEIPTVLRQRQ